MTTDNMESDKVLKNPPDGSVTKAGQPRIIHALAPAKLNLFLHVTGRRDDGYHTLQTAFQLLDWGDSMTFEFRDDGILELATEIPGIEPDDNLIIKAATLLQRPGLGARISIDKHIPMGGGLGGGSSNAATTLLALNRLWGLDLSVADLARLGVALGADVPVFVHGTSAWAEGIGDQLTPLELPERWYVILRPDCHVSTAEIFSAPELTRDTSAITMSAFFGGRIRNDLQPVVSARYPAVKKALIFLNKLAPAMMTGSGSCIFAAVDDEADARAIASACDAVFDTVVAKGVNRSPNIVAQYC